MNASDLLLDQWSRQVKELFPMLHAYQQDALAFAVAGIMHSETAVMQRVAEAVWERSSSLTSISSHERRLQRFVANERIEVQACWAHVLAHILPFWHNKPVTLILDVTPYSSYASIVYVGILLQSRVLPLAWEVMPQQQSWEQGQWQIVERLFEQISAALLTTDCTLLADRGLSGLPLIRLCQKQGWHYLLRIRAEDAFRRKFRHYHRDWEQGQQVVKKEGEQWYGRILLWQEHQFDTWLSASWEAGYEEAWFLISDRRASAGRIGEYGQRMSVEATFQDSKSRGCMIEDSRFRQREHLHRWLFAVFLAMWWMAHLGQSCIHHGHRKHVDRCDRRDKGFLRIGRLWLKAILKKATQALFRREKLSRIQAQLANCLLFSHRNGRLFFSIYRS